MDPFEYVIILTSLILGLGISQILIGVANLITNKNIKWSLPHFLMTLHIFLTQIQEWWITYSYSMNVSTWTLPLVMILMIYPILLFVAARVLFPYEEIENKPVDLESYYWKKWPVLFTIFALAALTSIIQNYMFSGLMLIDQIPQLVILTSYLVFLIGDIKRRSFHIAFLGLQLIGWVVYLFVEDFVIGI